MTDAVDAYLTVAGRGQAEFTVRGSEFIGHIAPAETVADAEAFVTEVNETYPDATHNVPAYRVRANPLREWSSDEGEPAGSAGKPALNVLQGQDLENVAVVVTRYYGGTNLGVGGLVRAYSRAVKEAVADARTVEEVPHERVTLTVTYDDSGTVRGILESAGVEFDADYAEDVRFDVRVPSVEVEELLDRVRSATSGRADVEE
jgi:uncharacterized YigZ family protein